MECCFERWIQREGCALPGGEPTPTLPLTSRGCATAALNTIGACVASCAVRRPERRAPACASRRSSSHRRESRLVVGRGTLAGLRGIAGRGVATARGTRQRVAGSAVRGPPTLLSRPPPPSTSGSAAPARPWRRCRCHQLRCLRRRDGPLACLDRTGASTGRHIIYFIMHTGPVHVRSKACTPFPASLDALTLWASLDSPRRPVFLCDPARMIPGGTRPSPDAARPSPECLPAPPASYAQSPDSEPALKG